MKFSSILALGAFLAAGSASAATINVPADQGTIQAAIDAASNGDTVLVAPGTYYEQLDFKGKAITVTSSGGAAATVLDGSNGAPIITFNHGETSAAMLQGFTLTHAKSSNYGAAMQIAGTASPTIVDNDFIANSNVSSGGQPGAAIGGSGFGSPVIMRNYFADNICLGTAQGSVVGFNGSPVIADNVFANNSCPAVALLITTTASPHVYNNTLVGNMGGVLLTVYSGTTGTTFVSNNVIAFGLYGLSVTLNSSATMPSWSHNLVYGNTEANYLGVSDQTGTNGNISVDPVLKYWLGRDIHLLSSSPAIDAGDSTVSQASAIDYYGAARVFAGGASVVDIGAAENDTTDNTPGVAPVINVPADQPTIQAGIDAASDGDVVQVAPGTYYEQLDFGGKAITVKGKQGAAVTILDGNGGGPIVNFHTYEWNNSVLQGFTLTHARQDNGLGAAISLGASSPTIEDDVFTDNLDADGEGACISGNAASPIIIRNYFWSNSGLDNASNPFSVIWMVNGSSPVVADDIFANNSLIAYYQAVPSPSPAPRVYNNTMFQNTAGLELVVYANNSGALFDNNLIAFNQTGVEISLKNGASMPVFNSNLVYGNTTSNYDGVTDPTGTNGNISVDPQLKDWADGDVHLLYGSPAIDAGDNNVIQVSATDIYSNARVVAGDPNGSSVVDIGAAEFHTPVVTAVDGAIAVEINTTKSAILSATGADPAEPVTFSIVTEPSHGSVSLTDAATGAFKYTPASGFAGSDSFTFQVTDAYGTLSGIATESITVNDVAPTATSATIRLRHGRLFRGLLRASKAYAGQILTYSLVSGASHGTVTIVDASRGIFSYAPASGYRGTDRFTFHVTDQWGTVSNTATVTVTVL